MVMQNQERKEGIGKQREKIERDKVRETREEIQRERTTNRDDSKIHSFII